MPIRQKWDNTGYIINLNGETLPYNQDDTAVFAQTTVMRIDPINSCNAQCVFCDSYFGDRSKRLDYDLFQQGLDLVSASPVLHTIQFGCTYEPTLHQQLSTYGEILRASGLGPKTKLVSIVSNCWTLDKHDLESFVLAGLNKLHVSFHAHDAETFQDVMGKAANFDKTIANLKAFKQMYPHVPISMVCVVNKANYQSLLPLVDLALFDIGADYLRFTRAQIKASQQKTPSNRAVTKISQNGFELTDEDWQEVVQHLELVDTSKVDFNISKQRLKNGAISVDALRLKKVETVKEARSPDASRELFLQKYKTLVSSSNSNE